MALRSDFRLITFNKHLGNNEGDIDAPSFQFLGNQASKTFTVEGRPTGSGYLIVNTFDVDNAGHRVQINGKNLGGFDLPKKAANNRWQTRMDPIERGILQQGTNTIVIKRASGGDNFLIGNVVVHWRESDGPVLASG
jgi:hypothetical protein